MFNSLDNPPQSIHLCVSYTTEQTDYERCYIERHLDDSSALCKRTVKLSDKVFTFLNDDLQLTFDGDIDSLRDEQLWLDEYAADVGPLIHPLLNIAELQGPILINHLHRNH